MNSKSLMITVVETVSFVADAKCCMSDDERIEAINMLAANPECGDIVPGGGGIRKVRFAIGCKVKVAAYGSSTIFTTNGFQYFCWPYSPKMIRQI